MDFLSEKKLAKILAGNKEIMQWFQSLIVVLPVFKINTIVRVASFLSQTGHESTNFTTLQENLNYSANGLLKVFSKYFDSSNVNNYAHKPQAIANRIYADRMGNGNELSGDGFKYRGRGILQITGKSNYQLYSAKIYGNNSLVDNPDISLSNKNDMIKIACCFWVEHGLNNLADVSDITAITKKINGGSIGLSDRILRFNEATKILSE